MPRIPRGQVAGHAYHVLNRGNGGAAVFHKDGDYTAFLDLLATAKAKYPVTLFGVCLMPTHVHLVVQPATEAALSPFKVNGVGSLLDFAPQQERSSKFGQLTLTRPQHPKR